MMKLSYFEGGLLNMNLRDRWELANERTRLLQHLLIII